MWSSGNSRPAEQPHTPPGAHTRFTHSFSSCSGIDSRAPRAARGPKAAISNGVLNHCSTLLPARPPGRGNCVRRRGVAGGWWQGVWACREPPVNSRVPLLPMCLGATQWHHRCRLQGAALSRWRCCCCCPSLHLPASLPAARVITLCRPQLDRACCVASRCSNIFRVERRSKLDSGGLQGWILSRGTQVGHKHTPIALGRPWVRVESRIA